MGGKKLKCVPWGLLQPHAEQVYRNHGQSLTELASRGGLCAAEALAILDGRRWSQIVERANDEEVLQGLVDSYNARVAPTKPCHSPYCECSLGQCTHPGFHDARGEPL